MDNKFSIDVAELAIQSRVKGNKFHNEMSFKMNTLIEDLIKKLNKQIIKNLEKAGHIFEDDEQLFSFIKERCCQAKQGNFTTFFVDREPFLTYDHRLSTRHENGRIILTLGGQ